MKRYDANEMAMRAVLAQMPDLKQFPVEEVREKFKGTLHYEVLVMHYRIAICTGILPLMDWLETKFKKRKGNDGNE